MKKLLIVLPLFATILFMNCEENPDDDTPENIFKNNVFANREIEEPVTYNTPYKKFSFTETEFTFIYKTNDYHIDNIVENIYTGTYSLFYGEPTIPGIDSYRPEYIKFVSSNPDFNCIARYYEEADGRMIFPNLYDLFGGTYLKIN